MATGKPIQSTTAVLRTALAVGLTALLAGLAAVVAPSGSAGRRSIEGMGSLTLVSTTDAADRRTWTYGWPVKPFDRQHPVRGFLNDPRIGNRGGTSFHFGIDISVPDGTPVYAVAGGVAYVDTPGSVGIATPDGRSFGYWHIVPAVRTRQLVRTHDLIGHVAKGWAHVHFAERSGDLNVNPLRNGGLGPYADHTAPKVTEVVVSGSDLVATAYDTPDPAVPGAWRGLPVTPALLRWRIAGGSWHTAVDSRQTMRPRAAFAKVFTPRTRQNHEGKPGRYSYYLQRGWRTNGPVRLEIEVRDTAGNATVASRLVGTEG